MGRGTVAPNRVQNVGTAGDRGEASTAPHRYFVGRPDGPEVFSARMGISVPTFTERRDDLRIDSSKTWLMHHVPPPHRGHYRPEQMANYSPEDAAEYRVDPNGYLMCDGITMADTICMRRAVNKSSRCQAHGGKLHPLDKVFDERRPIKAEVEPPPQAIAEMTRWQKLIGGFITVDDLDDEELNRGQCRDARGGFSGPKPKMIPQDIIDAMRKRIFDRVNETFMNDLIGSAQTMMKIATGDAYEPADQINAAKWAIERVMGKQPTVIVAAQEPWQEVFDGVIGGSRAASRAARGIASTDELLELEAKVEYAEEAPLEDIQAEEVSAIVEDTGVALFDPSGIPDPVERSRIFPPPQEPDARQVYEERLAHSLAEDAKTPQEQAAELKERIAKNRARRYVARANNLDTIRNLPIFVDSYPIATHPGLYRIKFTQPSDAKVPASVKSAETKRRNRQRRDRVD